MKIRFGILDEYKQFKVSCKLISQICSTWVWATAKVLSYMIKVWGLDRVNTLKQKKLQSVADVTEIFIQSTEDHLSQSLICQISSIKIF